MESFIVESESDFDVAIDYFSALVNKSEYHTANKFLDKIHTKSEKEAGFVQAQKINLEWLENPKDYKLTPGKKALLIKFGQQLHPISGYARGIYTKITGEYIEHSHPLPDKGVESRSESKADISEEITLYPNPSDTKLRISLLTGTTDHKIMIISAEGILIKEALVGSNTHYYEMDISDLKPGIYTIQTSGSNKPQVKKFVKL
ncbi:MAG: T9SS type A sorting domain-containing protein [Saprospiraceae bacterium]|nr:T9SS type A sorting domain-containing protein [Saprospiraceae bacterium]